MVSHLVLVADAHGHFADRRARAGDAAVRARHCADQSASRPHQPLRGPPRRRPENQAVEAATTTLPRRARLDELLDGDRSARGGVPRAVAMLRDHSCAGGISCARRPPGHRRAHRHPRRSSIATDRALWVSAGPHLSGQFVRFDLRRLFAADHDPQGDPPATLPETRSSRRPLRSRQGARDEGRRRSLAMTTSRRAFLAAARRGAARAPRSARADELSDALAAHRQGPRALKTLVGPFAQERKIGLLASEVRSTGTMTLVRPTASAGSSRPLTRSSTGSCPRASPTRARAARATCRGRRRRSRRRSTTLRVLLGGDLAQLQRRYDSKLTHHRRHRRLRGRRRARSRHCASRRSPSPWRATWCARCARPSSRGEGPRATSSSATLKRDVAVDPALMKPPS